MADLQRSALYLCRHHAISRYEAAEGVLSPVAMEINDPIALLRHVLDSTEPGAIYVLEDYCQFFNLPSVRSLWAELLDPVRSTRRQPVAQLLVLADAPGAAAQLPELLRNQIPQLPYPLPRSYELAAMVTQDASGLEEGVRQRLAASLAGLPMTRARLGLQEALVQGIDRPEAVIGQLQDQKEALLQAELGMSLLRSRGDEEPEGLEGVWEYLEANRDRIGIEGEQRLKGLLFVGPPGTGKTMVAKAIGRRVKLPVVNFEIGRLMNAYIGATENNVLRATATIDSMAPLVCMIDEIEKSLSGGESSGLVDGGVMARSYGILLSWLNDTRAPVLVVGTANRLDRLGDLGATLARRGRFDALFFVDLPAPRAWGRILARALSRAGVALDAWDLGEAIQRTEGFSGADLGGAGDRCRGQGPPLEKTPEAGRSLERDPVALPGGTGPPGRVCGASKMGPGPLPPGQHPRVMGG